MRLWGLERSISESLGQARCHLCSSLPPRWPCWPTRSTTFSLYRPKRPSELVFWSTQLSLLGLRHHAPTHWALGTASLPVRREDPYGGNQA